MVGKRVLEDRSCVLVRNRSDQVSPKGPANGTYGVNFDMFFDAETNLPAGESVVGTGVIERFVPVSVSQFRSIYHDLKLNPELPEALFAFEPPEGGAFVSPDDSRFAPVPKMEGKPAPEFSLASLESKSIKLRDYRYKEPVLVVFWATWCGPCNLEIPFLRSLRRGYGDDQLAILAVTHEDVTSDSVRSFGKKKKVNYLLLQDAKGEASKAYYAKSIPKSVLIDKSGTVVKVWEGWAGDEEAKEIRGEIAKLIGPPRKTAASQPAHDKPAP